MIMGYVHTAARTVLLLAFFALLPASCATDLSIEKRDGWPDAPPDEGEVEASDVPGEDDAGDVPGEDVLLPDCGNGEVDDGEECDGAPPRECTTSCDSTGIQACVDCMWGRCVPPCESCNDVDDDCDDDVDESGWFSTATAVRVSEDDASSTQAALAWSGTEFGLVWVDERGGQEDLFSRIHGADAAPVVDEVPLLTAETDLRDPSVLWANGVYNLVATDETGGAGRHVLCQRMDTVGEATGVLRVTGSTASVDFHAPQIVERTGGFAIVWDSAFTVHMVITNAQCNPAGVAFDLVTDGNVSRDARIASSGTSYGVVWVDERDGNPEIYAAVASNTEALCEVRLTDDPADSEQPDVVWDGSTFAVAWSDGRTDPASIHLTRFNRTCTEVGDDVRIAGETGVDATAPSVGWTGSALGVAWQEGGEIFLQAFMGEGHPLLCAQEISGGGDSRDPDLVVTDTGFGVSWNDDRAGNREIYLASVAHEDCP